MGERPDLIEWLSAFGEGYAMTRDKGHGGGDAGDRYAIYAAAHRAYVAVGQNTDAGRRLQRDIMDQLLRPSPSQGSGR